ncbi:MAG: helix-turn-helix domain-containing protein [Saprospiraceae bacterium]|jgi:excisionase family DNA binding protein|nr:helix-turn-helix domain-containing protein [Saprospiraceae bacterium]
MEKTVLISIPLEDLETVIIDCVNSCLKNNKYLHSEQQLETDRWFDLTEFCNYHPDKPSKQTVYGWVNAGNIPVHKGGKKLRFLRSEIDQWLKLGRKKTLAETAKEAEQYCKTKKV